MNMRLCGLLCLAAGLAFAAAASAQARPDEDVDTWVTATEQAAGIDGNAKDEAVRNALRKAVEQTCGVFIKGQSKTKDYKTVYDKVLANTAGYVLEYKISKTNVDKEDAVTSVTVKARVSTKKFEESWASIAHTINQENNPRVVVGIIEAVSWTTTGPAYEAEEGGVVQSCIEDFFNSKNITLMDKNTSAKVTKRDLLLASLKDDSSEVAAIGARFKADVVVVGKASAKIGKKIAIGDQELFQYTAALNVRAVQTDSGRVLASKTYTKTYNELQAHAESKVLAKLGNEYAPELLKALVEAWAKRANVSRSVELNVSGMDYDAWKVFKAEAEKIRGVQALRLREITESVANIDVEYEFTNENLADRISGLKDLRLKVTEITANRIKLKVVKE